MQARMILTKRSRPSIQRSLVRYISPYVWLQLTEKMLVNVPSDGKFSRTDATARGRYVFKNPDVHGRPDGSILGSLSTRNQQ